MGLMSGLVAAALGTEDEFAYLYACGYLYPDLAARLLEFSGLAHRICAVVPEDATAGGYTVSSGDKENITKEIDSRVGTLDRLVEGGLSARAQGGAWLWPICKDVDWSLPLDTSVPHEVLALQVVTVPEAMSITKWESYLGSPNFGRPEYIQITMRRDGTPSVTETVHTSHLCYIPGARAIPSQFLPIQGYDIPILQLYWPAIRDIEKSWRSGATFIERVAMPILNLMGKDAMLGGSGSSGDGDGEAEAVGRMQALGMAMRNRGLMLLFGEDKMSWSTPSISGYSEVTDSQASRLSYVEGIPKTRFAGESPGGFGTDDLSGQRAYDGLLMNERERYTTALQQFYTIAFGEDPDRVIHWAPLGAPGAAALADIHDTQIGTYKELVDMGIITQDDVYRKVVQDKMLPLDPATSPSQRALPVKGIQENTENMAEEQTAQPVNPATVALVADEPVAALALNGAQTASLVEIMQLVTAKQLAPLTAIELVLASNPSIERAKVELMVNESAHFQAASQPNGREADGLSDPLVVDELKT